MKRSGNTVDLPLILLAGLAVVTLVRLGEELTSIPWQAAGAIVIPVFVAGIVAAGSESILKSPARLRNLARPAHDPGAETLQAATLPGDETYLPDNEPGLLSGEEPSESEPEQSLRIWRSETGQESISGELMIHFAAGVRMVAAHVPWQPKLIRQAQAAVEVLDGEEVEVSVDILRPYGMKLIARRSGSTDQPGACHVEYYVSDRQAAKAAA